MHIPVKFIAFCVFAFVIYLIYLAVQAAGVKDMDAFAYHMVFAAVGGLIGAALVIASERLRKDGV